MIRVVVTGSECTGKTTLARSLAEHFRTAWVPEYARQFVEQKAAPLVSDDVEAIARGQIELEDAPALRASRLVIQDTDLLSTALYARHYYGSCPAWIERALASRNADLYLLADIDVPWIADGGQRDRGDRREEVQGLFRQALEERALRFVEIRGSRQRRFDDAVQAIAELVSED